MLPAQVTKKQPERLCIRFVSIVLIWSNKHNDFRIISTSNRTKRQSKVSATSLKGQVPFMSSAGRRPACGHVLIQEQMGSGLQDTRTETNR